jgi:integrase/recombinase XerD
MPPTVTQKVAALRFFFVKTLHKPWSVAGTPYPKAVRRLPTVLSQEEVTRLINSARNPFNRVLLMTLYATGARCAEATRLQVCDIDSQRMVVHIRGGKGREDRDVMLSPVLIAALREH